MFKILLSISILIFSESVLAQKSVTPWIGVLIDNAENGVLIKGALKDTPGEKAGLKKGDIVLKINGTKVSSPKEMITLVRSKGVGHKVILSIQTAAGIKETRTLNLVAQPDLLTLAITNLMNKKAPKIDLAVASKGKKRFILSEQKKVTIVEFWATWCGACAQALPRISKWAKKNAKNINFVSISSEDLLLIRKYKKQASKKKALIGNEVKFLHDDSSKVTAKYYVPALPMFFVIDKKNIIRHIAVGTGEELSKVFAKAVELTK